jgi:hypothetical protein
MMQEAKKAALAKLTGDKLTEATNDAVSHFKQEHGVELDQLEAYVNKPRIEWRAQEVLSLRSAFRSIKEGRASAQDVFPPIEKAETASPTATSVPAETPPAAAVPAPAAADVAKPATPAPKSKVEPKPKLKPANGVSTPWPGLAIVAGSVPYTESQLKGLQQLQAIATELVTDYRWTMGNVSDFLRAHSNGKVEQFKDFAEHHESIAPMLAFFEVEVKNYRGQGEPA